MIQKKHKRKILIVDDDPRILEMIRMILENRDYGVEEATNGYEALSKIETTSPDLVLLDVMMPVMDGLQCCLEIRKISEIPIIMLTAKGEDDDQIAGLCSGADDYVIKPFTSAVLVARIESAIRRANIKNIQSEEDDVLKLDKLEIRVQARTVVVENQIVNLNKKEYDLLFYMVKNRGLSLSRAQILENVWGYDYLGSESTVDTHINRLRNKLGICSQKLITMRGYGYKFENEY